MRWPWQPDPEHVEGLQRAEERRDEVAAQWPTIHRVTAKTDRRREVNGFAQQIRDAMGVTR